MSAATALPVANTVTTNYLDKLPLEEQSNYEVYLERTDVQVRGFMMMNYAEWRSHPPAHTRLVQIIKRAEVKA